MVPYSYLLIAQVSAYCSESPYNWKAVNCSGSDLKQAIINNRHRIPGTLVGEQLSSNKSLEDQYKGTLETFRRSLREIPETTEMFPTAEEFMHWAFGIEGSIWKLGASLMNKAVEIISEESKECTGERSASQTRPNSWGKRFTPMEAERFASVCPPFNSLLYGIGQTEYTRVHDPSVTSRQRVRSAGRTDTYMSVYLPYCRFFITNDQGQFKCLSPTASRIQSDAEVLMYDDFWRGLPH